MEQTISYVVNVEVGDGPSVSCTASVAVEAYDKIDVKVAAVTTPAGGGAAVPGTATVDVQPSGTGKVQLLVVTSDLYSTNLIFKVTDSSGSSGTALQLDGPLFLLSKGAVEALGKTPNKLVFSNTHTKAASVSILVGRQAT